MSQIARQYTFPLPVRLLQRLIQKSTYPVLTIGAVCFFSLLGFFAATGVLYPGFVQQAGLNPLESTGLSLLMSSLPAYMLMCLAAQVRAMPDIKAALRRILPASHRGREAALDHGRHWWLGALLGVAFAITSNINWDSFALGPDGRTTYAVGVVTGQFILWGTVGLMLHLKIHNALVLHKLGKLVQVDIFNPDRLNVFGRVGLNDLLVVVGAMALTPLQSIDQEFRWINYANAVWVGVPSAITLMLLPIWSVHRRILRTRQAELVLINAQIDLLPKSLEPAAVEQLNALLDRRNHVQHSRNWPMDVTIFAKVVFYVLIPPLAWAGAALVELLIDAYIVG